MGTTYVPTPVSSGFRDTSFWDTELSAIASELANKVDRNGVAPNAMAADFDLGSNQGLNFAEGVLGTDAVNLNQVQNIANAAAAAVAAPATSGSEPLTFNFGVATGSQGTMTRTVFDLNTLFAVTEFNGLTVVVNGVVQVPALAYSASGTVVTFTESLNTDSDVMFIYGDLTPTPVFSNVNATLSDTTATATLGQTVFTAPTYVIGSGQLMVFIDGIRQTLAFGDYTETTTTSITFDEAMAGGERVTITNITGL